MHGTYTLDRIDCTKQTPGKKKILLNKKIRQENDPGTIVPTTNKAKGDCCQPAHHKREQA